jgi:hypothetical protein
VSICAETNLFKSILLNFEILGKEMTVKNVFIKFLFDNKINLNSILKSELAFLLISEK